MKRNSWMLRVNISPTTTQIDPKRLNPLMYMVHVTRYLSFPFQETMLYLLSPGLGIISGARKIPILLKI